MESWDLTTLDVEVHKPEVLLSEEGVARTVAVNLPAGDLLQDHETHEHVYLVVVDGQLEIEHDGGTQSAGVGYVAHFEPHERREVRAAQDSRFLLFLAPWPAPSHHT
jgi:quercetin dioxygenase-like cupin family protein